MSDTVLLALISFGSTAVVTCGAVALAYLKLKEPIHEVRRTTNGLLAEANARADAATHTLAVAAADALRHTTPDGAPDDVAP